MKTEVRKGDVIRRREAAPVRAKRILGRFRSRHPWGERIAKNLTIVGAVTAPLALSANRRFRKAVELATKRGVPIGRSFAIGARKIRSRNWITGDRLRAVRAPSMPRIAKRKDSAEIRRLMRSGGRRRMAAYVVGAGGTAGAVGVPLFERRGERRFVKDLESRPHLVVYDSGGRRHTVPA